MLALAQLDRMHKHLSESQFRLWYLYEGSVEGTGNCIYCDGEAKVLKLSFSTLPQIIPFAFVSTHIFGAAVLGVRLLSKHCAAQVSFSFLSWVLLLWFIWVISTADADLQNSLDFSENRNIFFPTAPRRCT